MAETGMTREQRLVRHIAEKVMGWTLETLPNGTIWAHSKHPDDEGPWCLKPPRWDPLTSDADALEALEAWCDAGHRWANIVRATPPYWAISLKDSAIHTQGNIAAGGHGHTLSLAIVGALCMATGFQEAEDVKDED